MPPAAISSGRSKSAGTHAHAYGLALDPAGNVFTVGMFTGSTNTGIDCDPGAGSAFLLVAGTNYFQEGYLSELSPAGNFLGAWETTAAGNSAALTSGVALGSDGSVYTAGFFVAATTIDTGTSYAVVSSSGSDGFVARMTPGQNAIMGQVFKDNNNNGVKDSGDSAFPGVTVYLDLNNNGVKNAGEPSTTTNALGGFSFSHLAAGTYNVRQVLPSGYTGAPATSNVTVAAGQFDDSTSFADYRTPRTTVYSNTNPVTTSNKKPNAVSTMAISDSYPIQDFSVTLNVSNSAHRLLTVILYAPDGTAVTLAANITSTGTLTYHVPSLIGKNAGGTWTLEVDGLAGGTLNSWSMSVFG